MQLEVSVLSNAGGREPNEDAYGFWTGGGGCFCVMCDGAGGYGGGDIASKLAVGTVLSAFQAAPQCTPAAIEAALFAAHQAIIGLQGSEERLSGMRATVAVLAIDTVRSLATWGHVGDTRVYCFRERRVLTKTKDHSVVQRMIDAGYLAPAAVRESAQRSRLFAALGHTENFVPTIEASLHEVLAGDAFLLCTDGFWEYVDEPAMEEALAATASAAAWLGVMETQVATKGGNGQDNFSALGIRCGVATPPGDPPAQ